MSDLFNIILTVLGIGLLIFLHELGHFLAARWSGVRVDAFSLGFGPVLFSRQKGPTEYRLSLFPIGGYVKLAGELPNEEKTGAPDELSSKSIGTRAFIFSAGVIANLLIALVLFPILFFVGVPFVEPVIGSVAPGSSAWKAGIEPGSKVLEIDGDAVYGFENIAQSYALAGKDGVKMLIETPKGERKELFIRPDAKEEGIPMLGVMPIMDRNIAIVVKKNSAASEAGLQTGDQILKIDGKAIAPTDLTIVEKARSETSSIELELKRGEKIWTQKLTPRAEEKGRRLIGVLSPFRKIFGIRSNPASDSLGLELGDVISQVNQQKVLREGDLKQFLLVGQENRVLITRKAVPQEKTLRLPDEASKETFIRDLALGQDFETNEVVPKAGYPAMDAGLQPGDRILQLGSTSITQYSQLLDALQKTTTPELALVIQRGNGDSAEIVNLVVRPRSTTDYGLQFLQSVYTYRTSNLIEAFRAGWKSSWKMVEDLYLSIKKVLTKEIPAKSVLGGIITIGGTAFQVSQMGFTKLLFFLAILSINLAVLNVLPIPVLDGGHLFFLLIEKIKGSPVSERVLGYSQIVGVALLLALMIFATYNDIRNWFF